MDETLLPLAHPDEDHKQLVKILGDNATLLALYRILYETREAPLTQLEIASRFADAGAAQSQLDRRRRDLYPHFAIKRVRHTGEQNPRYVLVGMKPPTSHRGPPISQRVRAEVLQFGRCAMCGASPRISDEVVLVVDHKIPTEWGGTNNASNLQALCEPCNAGKKNHYATLDKYGDEIAAACKFDEVHRRLGELLARLAPDEVRSDLLELVANFEDVQEDWQKRLRELREIGWDYEVRRQKDANGRTRTYYRLKTQQPWPPGSIRTAIREQGRAKQAEG